VSAGAEADQPQKAYSLDGAARTNLRNISPACATPRWAFTITLLARTCSAMRRSRRADSNGDQVSRVTHLALKRGKSVDFTGYWQRHIAGLEKHTGIKMGRISATLPVKNFTG
jgi:hypothetical protein